MGAKSSKSNDTRRPQGKWSITETTQADDGKGRLTMKRCWAFVAVAVVVAFSLAADRPGETALDRYIARPDPAYSWKLLSSTPGFGYKAYVIELTSQTWRSAEEVDRPRDTALVGGDRVRTHVSAATCRDGIHSGAGGQQRYRLGWTTVVLQAIRIKPAGSAVYIPDLFEVTEAAQIVRQVVPRGYDCTRKGTISRGIIGHDRIFQRAEPEAAVNPAAGCGAVAGESRVSHSHRA